MVLACPGLTPFFVATLDKVAELCACLSELPCQVGSRQGPKELMCAYAVEYSTLTAMCT